MISFPTTLWPLFQLHRNQSSQKGTLHCITCMYGACHGDQLSCSNVKQTIAVVLVPFLRVSLAMAHIPSFGIVWWCWQNDRNAKSLSWIFRLKLLSFWFQGIKSASLSGTLHLDCCTVESPWQQPMSRQLPPQRHRVQWLISALTPCMSARSLESWKLWRL